MRLFFKTRYLLSKISTLQLMSSLFHSYSLKSRNDCVDPYIVYVIYVVINGKYRKTIQSIEGLIYASLQRGFWIWHYDGEDPALEIWVMWSTLSLPGSLWLGVILPVRVSSIGQIELFTNLTVWKQMTDVKLNC